MKTKKSILWLLTIVMIFTMLVNPTMEVDAANTVYAAKTLKITKASTSTAKKIDKYLLKGTPVVIKVKGSASSSEKVVKKLQNLIKKVNKQGVVFQYEKVGKSRKYYTYKISKDNAKLYKYSVEFIKKLFTKFQNGENLPGSNWYEGEYGSGDNSVNNITEYRCYYELYKYYKQMNKEMDFIDLFDYGDLRYEELRDDIYNLEQELICTQGDSEISVEERNSLVEKIKDEIDKKKKEYEICEDVCGIWVNQEIPEFVGLTPMPTKEQAITQAQIYEIAFSAKNFSELSDAMKFWVIATSGYFYCNSFRDEKEAVEYNTLSNTWIEKKHKIFGMVYNIDVSTEIFSKDWKNMRCLSQNKAEGVCWTFAYYEKLVFEQLGIKVYENRSDEINHAWTVIKVKNSKDKTLWIPFDYGIGPSAYLASYYYDEKLKEKYGTENKRFKLYLKGIKGAPKKRNFNQTDFN